jgi:hypothetical protein
MNNNSMILKNCPNYNKIINFNYTKEDYITSKLIKIYKEYVLLNEDVDTTHEIDRVLNIYIDNFEFRKELQEKILNVRVKKDNNILKNIVLSIIKIFSDYEEYTTRKLYIARWI